LIGVDLQLIQKATILCQERPPQRKGGVRVIALVTDSRGHILSKGENSYSKTHPLQKRMAQSEEEEERVFLHAEISALVKIRWGKPTTIYVARLKKDGEYGMSRPCPICMRAIREAGINRVVYTTDDGVRELWIRD
jgi:deoxycytidylate deaminase